MVISKGTFKIHALNIPASRNEWEGSTAFCKWMTSVYRLGAHKKGITLWATCCFNKIDSKKHFIQIKCGKHTLTLRKLHHFFCCILFFSYFWQCTNIISSTIPLADRRTWEARGHNWIDKDKLSGSLPGGCSFQHGNGEFCVPIYIKINISSSNKM